MNRRSSSRSLHALLGSLRRVAELGREMAHVLGTFRALDPGGGPGQRAASPETAALMDQALVARRAGRTDEAAALYRRVLGAGPVHVPALRALRELAVESGRWAEALAHEERLHALVPASERAREGTWLAVIQYELGRAELVAGRAAAAVPHLRAALRIDRGFLPAAVALGDALESSGEGREAVKVWERAAEREPALPLLARLERVYRNEGRPSQMIALYRAAVDRAPENLAVAVALGRVYFELEMLDEALEQFEKVEVRAPAVATVHAFLGAVFERQGQTRDALEEYRKALGLARGFTWPHRCRACASVVPLWEDRCARCGQWNSIEPLDGR